MQNNEQRPRVTVEDLLRLKRAERPSAEFWTGFERELRQKQLAALLEKRPWWQELPRWAARHAYLPMGAAAAVAFAFVTLRNGTVVPPAIGEAVPAEYPRVAAEPVSSPVAAEVVAAVVETPLPEPAAPVEKNEVAMAATVPGNVGEMIPWSAPRTVDTPSSRSIAETLAHLEQTEPELLEPIRTNRLATAPRMVAVAERAAVELASVSVDSTARRSNRLLVGYEQREFAPEPAAPDPVRERIARRLGDPDLLDQVRRVDVRGDRLSLKL
ncbi:MAG TPA: hypothetical protein VEB66_01950 [Opitutaceae bacterium]|nr:hypothetical protein [Opitutaceae bacterium]